nr:DUF5336 domain-containing protein [Micromonospora sp. DSM 115978]
MPLAIGRTQQATVSHRQHFFGRPAGHNTISWAYQGRPWTIERPADGDPPTPQPVQCATCRTTLRYTIHSVAATRRRQIRWQVFAYLGLVAFLVGFVGLFTIDSGGPGRIAVTLVLFFGGAVLGWVCGLAAAGEIGVTGHGASWPGPTKHLVTVVEAVPDDMPDLVCPDCGHQEEVLRGSHYRKGFLRKRYEAAKARFDEHDCGHSGGA